MRVKRLGDGPIIFPELHPSIGVNIQGPSAIRVPDWVANRLGAYYLYFADHKGRFIRLAYADRVTGPWTVHPPGALQLERSHFLTEPPEVTPAQLAHFERRIKELGIVLSNDLVEELSTPHIASPDAHIDPANRRIVMYFHGLDDVGKQVTRAAVSPDGLNFIALPEVLGPNYLRAFRHDGMVYALTMPGRFLRSRDGLHDFEAGPVLFDPRMRHSALLRRGNDLFVFWTQVGDAPERILVSRIDISGDWMGWKESDPIEVLRPEYSWEGADAPVVPSIRSTAHGHVNQLRDPAILEDAGHIYLFYAVAGESGIALAEVLP